MIKRKQKMLKKKQRMVFFINHNVLTSEREEGQIFVGKTFS